ncbi:hypothetical protein BT63DRAFT_447997 [Microthyrium microscopicum]|uniref:Alpha/beta-hydrolase n=1 Tax=Microthyrium microscopicum TaxID=703497 RepID=A0A6A6U1S0_9PEZI|nr:hypothetical protein BT63DRAFT_447997 [Microthyrium microscopicum]
MRSALLLPLAQLAAAQTFPAKADGDVAGGIFSISLPDLGARIAKDGAAMFGSGHGKESPAAKTTVKTGGTGPYIAQYQTDPTIPSHVVYAPKTPPPIPMPVIVWGNGGCQFDGTAFSNFLTEIASHGYLVVADGPPGGTFLKGQSKVQDMRDSVDWVEKGGAAKYGQIDTKKIIAAGQSCGGLEAYSMTYHDPRIIQTMHFNIGIFQDDKKYLLKEIKVPQAYFLGGPHDIGYLLGEKDYSLLNAGLPAFKASLDTGHDGTYWSANGGKFGKAAVAYLQWQLRGDAKSKAYCLGKGAGSLVGDNWNVTSKNWT